MRQARVRDLYGWLDSVAPFDSQEEYDNSRLILGRMDSPVSTVLLALDATPGAAAEAEALRAELMITHHPLIFHPLRSLNEENYEAGVLSRLIRGRVALIAGHTNLDRSPYSGSAGMAALLKLRDPERSGDYLHLGSLPRTQEAGALRARIEEALGGTTLLYGRAEAPVRRLAVGGGAMGEAWAEARAAGADALLTGEVRHHEAVAAAGSGFVLFCAGHFQTEAPMLPLLADGLQRAMDALQYSVRVCVSASHPYAPGTPKEEA